MTKAAFISQSDVSKQVLISEALEAYYVSEGFNTNEVNDIIEIAMDGRINDLEEVINLDIIK